MGNLLIKRGKVNRLFSTINLTSLLDNNLSWRAKGLHIYFLSRPEGWQIWRNDLLKKSKDGSTSLNAAIKELKEYNYISVKYERDDKGKFINTTYCVEEEPVPQDHPQARLPEYRETRKTDSEQNSNKNDSNKNNNTVPNDINDIFSEWNNNKIIVHRDLTQPIFNSISRALKLYSKDEIIEAIKNYTKIISSDLYFFSYKWSLQEFLNRGTSKTGQSNNKGFIQFLSENNPFQKFIRDKNIQEIDILLKEFAPITVTYKSRGIDQNTQTYLGFKIENLNNSFLIQEYVSDIKRNYNNSCFGFGDYCYLEEAITSIFFNRKAGYDMELLKALLSIWKEMKPKFKMQAARQLED